MSAGQAPPWLRRMHELLVATRLPVKSVVVRDRAVDVTVEVGGQTLVAELRPRDEGGKYFAVVGRHLLRYRAPRDLLPAHRPVLEFLLRAVTRCEPLLPGDFRGGAAVGDAPAANDAPLRGRFPFAFVERSESQGRPETEVLVRATELCNQRCPFCSAPPQRQPSPEAFAECLDHVAANYPGARVTITGGEPTLRARFVEELEDALRRPEIARVQVQTNAVAFAPPARAARLPRDPRLGFFVSLHAVDEAIYDRMTATTGQLPLALDGIRNLLAGGHAVVLNVVACSANLGHLGDLVAALPARFAGLPTPGLHFSVLICPDGRPDAADYLVRYTELAPALEEAAARAASLGLRVEPLVSSTHASLPLCLVDEEQRRASTHRPRPAPDETGYEDFSRRWVKAARCRGCAATETCLGLPAPYALRFGFDELAPFGVAPATAAAAEPASAAPRHRRSSRLPVPEVIVRSRPAAPEVVCTRPWTTLEIDDPGGDARQCCADWTAGVRGTFLEATLLDLWNGPGYQAARRALGGGRPSELCLPVCPRLHDGAHAERRLQITSGSERFVKNQLLLAEEIAARKEVVQAMPLYLTACPSSYCNADCIMCLRGREPRRDLPERFWDELPRFLPTLERLTLLGGEPLANPRVWGFLRDVDVAAYPDLGVDLITNGGLLGENALRQIPRAALGGVTISLNAGTAEVYQRVQRGLRFAEVLANLDALIRFRDGHPRWFGIALSFVVQPASVATVIPFAEIAHARDLDVRFLPLTVPGIPELDFYGSPEEVARVVVELDRLLAWTDRVRPAWRGEIKATKQAILATHEGRKASA